MPKLIKLYIRNVIIGFAIAAAFVAMLLWFNVMNMWHLVSTSDVGILAVLVLWLAHGVVFAGVQFAWAVMSMAERDESGPRGNTPVRIKELHPVPVEAKSAPRARHLPRRN
ncbi:hypothetical protein [Antarcticimicrobium sediminis]|uniref:Uncharacterized protein n=1 Tax=Antarcticimicrobium sediminis TaxID=2546227 RepID=A0A4R5F178_9RHOB|nr:hypothetical protein [Antarcticimicrobium sediminis]TDE40910.1 hypothetical protein E1B25_01470 [Antarcticimicrobium sediminis]